MAQIHHAEQESLSKSAEVASLEVALQVSRATSTRPSRDGCGRRLWATWWATCVLIMSVGRGHVEEALRGWFRVGLVLGC